MTAVAGLVGCLKSRPILMSAPMVRALLEGRKTQTRRIIKPQPIDGMDGIFKKFPHQHGSPYGESGNLLWVREAFAYNPINYPSPVHVNYRATETGCYPWKPSIHMPRWASRLTLEITDVRVQGLQEISEEDAKAEGCVAGWLDDAIPETPIGDGYTISSPGTYASAAGQFQILWDSINGEGSWDTDPWVWCLSFRVHQQNIDGFVGRRAA